ncbi:hypothetical protein ACIBHY_36555 [Nonomuraea sp. NPDC050547]|uniref:hypothetical protein n=1 Tax=Nonomuraea sp. NPDC050547 TaxID=3364368 RepID=UPI0037B28BEE
MEASDLLRQRLAALSAAAEEIGATIRRAHDQDLAWWFLIEEDYRPAKVEAERAFVERLAASVAGDDYHRAWNHHVKGLLPPRRHDDGGLRRDIAASAVFRSRGSERVASGLINPRPLFAVD